MKDEQKRQIIALRREGAGYGSIASQLGLSINTVKSYCRRHSLATPKAESVCENHRAEYSWHERVLLVALVRKCEEPWWEFLPWLFCVKGTYSSRSCPVTYRK
jgi:hypothetical protein